jgi:hypothetical protein
MHIGNFTAAAAVAEQNEAVAKRTANPTTMMIANWMLGVSHHALGDQVRAQRYCETALKPEAMLNSSLICSGYDQCIRALIALARSLWLQGYADRAVTVATQALHRANALDHPVSLCVCWISTVTVFLWTGDWSEAERIIDRLIEVLLANSSCHWSWLEGRALALAGRYGSWPAPIECLS